MVESNTTSSGSQLWGIDDEAVENIIGISQPLILLAG